MAFNRHDTTEDPGVLDGTTGKDNEQETPPRGEGHAEGKEAHQGEVQAPGGDRRGSEGRQC